MSVHVHVERLILDGLALNASEAAALQAAFESELAHLFGAQPIVQAPSAQAALGQRVAQAVYRRARP